MCETIKTLTYNRQIQIIPYSDQWTTNFNEVLTLSTFGISSNIMRDDNPLKKILTNCPITRTRET